MSDVPHGSIQRCPSCGKQQTLVGYTPGDYAPCIDCGEPVLIEGKRPDGSEVKALPDIENPPEWMKYCIERATKPNVLAEMVAPPDMVNHTPHYTSHPSGVECIEITEHMNFCVGNAMKYLWRAGEKGDVLEDLQKARWYIDREIARIEKKLA